MGMELNAYVPVLQAQIIHEFGSKGAVHENIQHKS